MQILLCAVGIFSFIYDQAKRVNDYRHQRLMYRRAGLHV